MQKSLCLQKALTKERGLFSVGAVAVHGVRLKASSNQPSINGPVLQAPLRLMGLYIHLPKG